MAIIRFQGSTSNSLIGMSIGFRCHDLGFENQNYLFIFGGSDRENICAHTAIFFERDGSSTLVKYCCIQDFKKVITQKEEAAHYFLCAQ